MRVCVRVRACPFPPTWPPCGSHCSVEPRAPSPLWGDPVGNPGCSSRGPCVQLYPNRTAGLAPSASPGGPWDSTASPECRFGPQGPDHQTISSDVVSRGENFNLHQEMLPQSRLGSSCAGSAAVPLRVSRPSREGSRRGGAGEEPCATLLGCAAKGMNSESREASPYKGCTDTWPLPPSGWDHFPSPLRFQEALAF